MGEGPPIVGYKFEEWAERQSYSPFPLPSPVPEADVLDTPQYVICFSYDWLPAIQGALETLIQLDAWVGDDAAREAAVKQAEELLAMTCNCGGFVTGMRIDITTGAIQIRFGSSEEWTNIENTTNQTTIISPPPVMTEFDNPRCTLSTWVRDELEDIVDSGLTIMAAATDVAEAAVGFIAEFNIFGVLLEALADAWTIIQEVTIIWLENQLTTEWYDDVQCLLHCALPEENPTWDDAIFEQWIADIEAKDDAGEAIARLMRAVPISRWQYAFWRAQYADNVASCGFCECEQGPENLVTLWDSTAELLEWSDWGPYYQKYHVTFNGEYGGFKYGAWKSLDGRLFKCWNTSNENFTFQGNGYHQWPNPYPDQSGQVNCNSVNEGICNRIWQDHCEFVTNTSPPATPECDLIVWWETLPE
jgi:hypothetical protein